MNARMLIAAAILAVGVTQLYAATITVTSTTDNGPGSLRAALANAADGDTIDASGISGTILLSSGELLVTNSVDIIGPGPDILAVNGNRRSNVFRITPSNTVNVSSLTITNGGPLSPAVPLGGTGIYNDHATLTVSNCVVSGNSASFGGGLYNTGSGLGGRSSLRIVGSTLSGNVAYGEGGGIYNVGGFGTATLEIYDSTLRDNRAEGCGGIDSRGNASVTIANSTLSGNTSREKNGGCICNYVDLPGSARLEIANSTLSSNSAYKSGGALDNYGVEGGTATVEIVNSTFNDNSAGSVGGSIYSQGGDFGFATVKIVNSTFNDNSATKGGSIYNEGTLQIANSTLSGNSATNGGGVFNESDSSLEIRNSTLNDNTANTGSGIYNHGDWEGGTAAVLIVNSTLSDNPATNTEFGSDIYNFGDSFWYENHLFGQGVAILQIVNSTLSSNSATNAILHSRIYNVALAPGTAIVMIASTILDAGVSGLSVTNDSGIVTSLGYNLSSDDGGGFLAATGDQTNTDPMLGPLQDNGGPTFTCALLPGSPAINAGDPNFTPPPDFDQRGPGFPRVVCGRIDIGAFEVQDTPVITCPANIVTDATSPAGAVVYFKPTAVDECSSVSISSTPRSGSLFAIGDTTVSCIAINETGYQATCSFTVHVKGAAEQIADLIVLVRSLNLKPWTTYILTAELQSASNALRRGNTRFACGDLDVFIFEVDMQTWWGQIRPLPRARLLVRDAQRIQNVLGCHDEFGDRWP